MSKYKHFIVLEDDCCNGFVCEAPPESICHARFDCSCEEYYELGVDNGIPYHKPDPEATLLHYGKFDTTFCSYEEWSDAFDELTHGKVKIPVAVQWNGDSYEFHYREPVEVVRSAD